MKKKILLILFITINALLYAKDPVFILNKDVTLKDGNWDEYDFNKGDIFIFDYKNNGFNIDTDSPLKIKLHLTNINSSSDEYFIVFQDDVSLANYSFKTNTNISKDFWIPSYYYNLLKSSNPTNDLLKYEFFWENIHIQTRYEDTASWKDVFGILKYYFGDYFFVAFGRDLSYYEVDFFAYLEEVSDGKVVYNIQKMYSRSFDYKDDFMVYPNQPEFLPLYEKATPFKVIFTIDGDYMNMYIDEISENNLFQTLVRTTPEACNQIENFILGKSKDLSKVVMPKHENNSATTTSSSRSQPSTNVIVNKIMLVTENLKLRSGEATTTSVLTVMQAGTKVKILELGKAETIDGIDSNWVKVEVQKGAKDRNGKEIKAGTVGWCYGGYLK